SAASPTRRSADLVVLAGVEAAAAGEQDAGVLAGAVEDEGGEEVVVRAAKAERAADGELRLGAEPDVLDAPHAVVAAAPDPADVALAEEQHEPDVLERFGLRADRGEQRRIRGARLAELLAAAHLGAVGARERHLLEADGDAEQRQCAGVADARDGREVERLVPDREQHPGRAPDGVARDGVEVAVLAAEALAERPLADLA